MSKKRYGNELHPLYSRWLSMTQRCTNPNHRQYCDYGARGITICDEFRDFKQYVSIVESLPNYSPEHTLDRRNNNEGYCPSNLRWTCSSTQIANQRPNSRGFNKFTGVNWSTHHTRWVARIHFKGKTLFTKVCKTEEEALNARNNFIVENNLPHPIQVYCQERATTIPQGSTLK